MKKYSRICAEINLDAIAYNFQQMHERMKAGSKLAAVIKADGYGHGAIQIARLIQNYDYIWGFAVAEPEEAMSLRRAGILKPILLLGYAFPESYEDIIDYEIRACIFDEKSAEDISKTAAALSKEAIIHLAVDTGMSRIGFADREESADIIKRISGLRNLRIEGMFTHFARADEYDLSPACIQMKRYENFSRMVAARGIDIPLHHISNSAGIMRLKEANLEMARAGITIYGLYPSEEVDRELLPLKPAMRLVSHISYVKTITAGTEVSYGGTFRAPYEMRIATIPAGYADGYPRALSGKGCVLIHGKRAPIVGRICMDQFMADVSLIPDVCVSDEAVLLGWQGDDIITAEEIGSLSGRFNYELVCDISKRVPRSYLKRGSIVEQVDYFN